ncbi:unnamed protein product [Diabrotica balteata]|uniref:Gamma-interferon-inducible lysosomal thiol reductase n=1 Tax=Diabrotica balteata TaxID=107213 RepID=A0A9N9T460_DIABA|nr:unnamed protein product [Diabrotica balteata]
MKQIVCSTIVILMTILNVSIIAQEQKVNVTLYYETLCPYARKFVVSQLHPTLEEHLSKYVNLEIIPYGKAKTIYDGDKITFTCQHGPSECYGNQILGCAQILIDSGANSPNLGYNTKFLEFVYCLADKIKSKATKSEVDEVVDKCASSESIGVTADQLKQCSTSKIGIQQMVYNGKLTDKFQNPLKHMPTIVVNGNYVPEESSQAQENLLKLLCSKISGEKPDGCK